MAEIIHSKKVDFENELDSLSGDTFSSKTKSFLYLEPSNQHMWKQVCILGFSPV